MKESRKQWKASVLIRKTPSHRTVSFSPSWGAILQEPTEERVSETRTDAWSLKGTWDKKLFIEPRQMRQNHGSPPGKQMRIAQPVLQKRGCENAGHTHALHLQLLCEQVLSLEVQCVTKHWLIMGWVNLITSSWSKILQDGEVHLDTRNRELVNTWCLNSVSIWLEQEWQHTVSTWHAQGTGIRKKATGNPVSRKRKKVQEVQSGKRICETKIKEKHCYNRYNEDLTLKIKKKKKSGTGG